MKKRIFAAPLLCSLMWTLPGVVALAPAARAQNAAPTEAPAEAFVTGIRGGDMIVLSVGTNTGAKVGAIYQIARDNRVAQLQIVEAQPTESIARVIAAETGGQSLLITVGDTVTYIGMAVTAPVEPPVAPPAQPLPPEQPAVAPTTENSSPATLLVTRINDRDVTLSAGTAQGVALGAIYVLPATGPEQARMIVVEVGADTSRARLLSVNDGFVPTVGENARFVEVQPIPAEVLSPVQVAPPVIITPTQPTVTAGGEPSSILVTGSARGALSGSTAPITVADDGALTIGAGLNQGAAIGQNLPVLRAGAVIGLVQITDVTADSASATVLYSDAARGPIVTGDAVGLNLAASALQSPVVIPAIGIPAQPIPAVPVRFESGASNVAVPKTYNTYELLASLAARGLIKSQPARVFQDDGARRHRVAEDIVFSRAQVAGFIVEALGNYDGQKGRDSAALSLLVKDFRRDLTDLNVPAATLNEFSDRGLQLGISSWTRLTAVGGDTNSQAFDAFDERFGAKRRKSGFDTRTNFFGTITPKLSFYASVDAGSDIRNGEPFGQLASSSFRKAYLSYDASSVLRGLTINVGRQEYWWGPGHFGTGLLSDASGGLDSLSTSFRRGSYELRGLYARLGTGPQGGSRSLYAQDLNVRIGKSSKFGINTAILSPNKSFDPTLFAVGFTPFPLYTIKRDSNATNNTNAIVSAYGEVGVAKGVRAYGEIVLDDLGTTQNNPIENRDGSIFGIGIQDPKDAAHAGFNLEYGRFNSVAYTYFSNRNNLGPDYYLYYRGAPLGYSIAPLAPTIFGGAENIRFDGYYRPLQRLTLFAGVQYTDLNAEDQNTNSVSGFSRQRDYRLAATYDLTKRYALTARYQRVSTDQPFFVRRAATRRDSIFSLEIGRSF